MAGTATLCTAGKQTGKKTTQIKAPNRTAHDPTRAPWSRFVLSSEKRRSKEMCIELAQPIGLLLPRVSEGAHKHGGMLRHSLGQRAYPRSFKTSELPRRFSKTLSFSPSCLGRQVPCLKSQSPNLDRAVYMMLDASSRRRGVPRVGHCREQPTVNVVIHVRTLMVARACHRC